MNNPAPLLKEHGYVVSVDPASNKCGIALWKDGSLVDWVVLESRSPRDPFSVRLQSISLQFEMFLRGHLGEHEKIHTVICEGVRSVLVQICVGALLVSPYVEAAMSSTKHFVHSTSWKKWAQNRGATGPLKDIKGVRALRETGKDFGVTADDAADAVLIYLTWRDRK